MIREMYWVAAEVLSVGAQLADAPGLPAPDVMKRRVATLLEELERRGAEAGIARADLEEAKYAIVAFIDEQLFRASWQGRQQWMLEPLQLVYFNENTAGEGFFKRLEALEQDPRRLHVLLVYYLCLTLGFQGKYAVRGGDGLRAIVDRIGAMLAHATGDGLSPRGLPADAQGFRARREAPILLVAAGLLAFALIVFVGLIVSLSSATSDATAHMKAATEAAQAKTPPRSR
jgi:type VI secretion system protein ImpK